MIAGKRYKGQDVDIWSCGVILFAMLCGYLPFEDPNTAQLYKKIPTKALPAFFLEQSKAGPSRVVLESCSEAFHVATWAKEAGLDVIRGP